MLRRYLAYVAWFEDLPPEVQAEIIRNQRQVM